MNRTSAVCRRRGAALISVLFTLTILLLLCGGFVSVTTRNVRNAKVSTYDSMLYYTASAGLEYAKWCVKHNMSYYPVKAYCVSTPGTTVANSLLPAGSLYNFWGTRLLTILPSGSASSTTSSDYGTTSSADTQLDAKRRTSEHVFISNVSFSGETGEAADPLQNERCFTTFQITARPGENNLPVENYPNYDSSSLYASPLAASGIVRNDGSGSTKGTSVMLLSTARIYRLEKEMSSGFTESLVNKVESGTTPISSYTGNRAFSARTVLCCFKHGMFSGTSGDTSNTYYQDSQTNAVSGNYYYFREWWR